MAADRKSFIARADCRRAVSMRGFALSATRDCDIQLRDLSYAGCGLCCRESLAPGEIVELRLLKRGAIDAQIRWVADGRAGARFLD